MQAFEIHQNITNQYKKYLDSFTLIKDARIRQVVNKGFEEGVFLPEALLQFNPAFATGQSLPELEKTAGVDAGLKNIFGNYKLYEHQTDAIQRGAQGEGFIVTSGTGSGKSLTFFATIFDHILKQGAQPGIRAILVYPMNALINSQEEEIKKYEINWLRHQLGESHLKPDATKTLDENLADLRTRCRRTFPITYAKYTGQEGDEQRKKIQESPANIIMTNYMMLELMMTRPAEKGLRESMGKTLRFLVFDELHTYRGRQGADVSLLIRRIKNSCTQPLICIGTSATMATDGTVEQRREAVASVATQIFGTSFSARHVLNEKLATCTQGDAPEAAELAASLENIDAQANAETFTRHPLARWLERNIALKRNEKHEWERARPLTLTAITEKLADKSGQSPQVCENALRQLLGWAEKLNMEGSVQVPRRSYLPFKIHQFISQLGNAYVTLEEPGTRKITLETGRYLLDDGQEKPIFPVMFSRFSGHEFICVKKDFETQTLRPRNPDDLPPPISRDELRGDRDEGIPTRRLTPQNFSHGYIVFDHPGEPVWSEDQEEIIESVPETWLTRARVPAIQNFYEFRIPRKIYFDAQGNFSDEKRDGFFEAWFVAARLLIDPTAGFTFNQNIKENNKLMRLGNEGRSTATTITGFNIISALHQQDTAPRNQKFLSFTDNRQDASLQAGHFNDFLVVARLRAAILSALKDAEDQILTIDKIADRVFKKLGLKEEEYARKLSDPDWSSPENEEAIKNFLLIRILYDLKRGWRYNTPNLEQCGLLEISYLRLDEFCAKDEFFAGLDLLARLSPKERYHVLLQILNYFRTSYAFDHRILLKERQDTENQIKDWLDYQKLWSLDIDESIEVPNLMYIRPIPNTEGRIYKESIGSRTALGKYIKRLWRSQHPEAEQRLNDEDTRNITEAICRILVRGRFLSQEEVRNRQGQQGTGYRLWLNSVLWKLGDGKQVIRDEVRVHLRKDLKIKPNAYFASLYQQDFSKYEIPFVGREHTGQLSSADRIDREDKFRSGKIAALFCSPTMELGIDISELNVVHMRNVPPNPANYAQRSGRAGRSGQAALVYTFCSNGSPHDRNYFRAPHTMVSGGVMPPKIDLRNEELISTHLNAFILMQLDIRELNFAVVNLLDENRQDFPVKADIAERIEDHITRFGNNWREKFRAIVASLPDMDKANWFTDEWISRHIQGFFNRFDRAFDRWRKLYQTAQNIIEKAQLTLKDARQSKDKKIKNDAVRQEQVGLRQRSLLRNESNNSYGNESEFYVYRYLASEGFLPGYNFTRLPVRAFLGNKHEDKGEFVSRPRFIALREFGPQNLVYHKGGKFRLSRMYHPQGVVRHKIRVSTQTGYAFLNNEGKTASHDPITNTELVGDAQELFSDLIELSESEAQPHERISCEEEERTSAGFEIDGYFSFSGRPLRKLIISHADQPLLQLIYDQSANLIQINRRWRISTNQGFTIGEKTGKWRQAWELDEPRRENDTDPPARVRIFTTDTADILYLQPVRELALSEAGVISLAYGLKRAIEKQFQVEENEIGVWMMGKGEHRNILFYENAEGSLGVLSQLIENGEVLHQLFVETYRLMHYNPENQEEELAADGKKFPRASYDDLLSYYNQRYHDQLDRTLLKTPLERLMQSSARPQHGDKTQQEQYEYLLSQYDQNSKMEKQLIDYLFANGLSLPDRAQFNIPDFYISADFVYKTQNGFTLVFCDGSVHDQPEIQQKDRHARASLRSQGYDVIEWHYSERIEQLMARRKDIFRKV